MAITFHLPPWLPLCLKWLRCYHNYRAEKTLVNFTPIECLAVHHVNPLSKIPNMCLHGNRDYTANHYCYRACQGGIRKIPALAIFFVKCLA